VRWERREREEGVDGDATDIVKVFGERGGDGLNFVGHLFVCECEGGGVGWREWRQGARHRRGVARAFIGVDGRAGLIRRGKAVDEAVGVRGGRDDQEDLDAGDTAFAWACGHVDPASRVSRVSNGYLDVSIWQVFYYT